ncbi:hypothetical protein VTI74DRAFT_5816 [Chaetomium olivicolor]
MARYSQSATATLATLVTLFSASRISSALQVTPNSPCSPACRDSLDLDASDPNSSNTRNSDITCQDAAYASAAGTKFRNCMTCLQTSTFSQGTESDTMWFLYNLRYTAAYCVFGYPNATGIPSTPCTTSRACGPLEASLKHGILDPRNTSAYSYCSAGNGEAMDSSHFESCIPCISAEGTTEYLANYFVALEAGCRQQPAPGVLLGLNDTVFSEKQISIVDRATLKEDDPPKQVLGTPVIVGIVAGAVVVLLIAAGVVFICLRKRRNKQARASAEADFYDRFNGRHRSSMSFQCQTHMISPRFWPTAGNEKGPSTPVGDAPDARASRSSIIKPHDPEALYNEADANNTPYISEKAAPLHLITTTISPPPQAHTSPSSNSVAGGPYYSPSDFNYRSPLSADSARSTSVLLPAIKPYVPAEHGVHVPGSPPSTFSSPVSATATTPGAGTGMTPLLKSHAWGSERDYRPQSHQQQLPHHQREQEQDAHVVHKQPDSPKHQRDPSKKHIIKPGNHVAPPPPPSLPALTLKTSRSNGLLGGGGKKSPRVVGQGSPVETWEIQTAFAGPPKR